MWTYENIYILSVWLFAASLSAPTYKRTATLVFFSHKCELHEKSNKDFRENIAMVVQGKFRQLEAVVLHTSLADKYVFIYVGKV